MNETTTYIPINSKELFFTNESKTKLDDFSLVSSLNILKELYANSEILQILKQGNTSIENILNSSREEELKQETDYFINLLSDVKFEAGLDNEATYFFAKKMNENRSVTREWITDLFNRFVFEKNTIMIIKILYLLADYPIKDLKPNGPLIINTAINYENNKVQIAALKVIGHWMDIETLGILEGIHINSPIIKIMLDKISKQIKDYHACKSI